MNYTNTNHSLQSHPLDSHEIPHHQSCFPDSQSHPLELYSFCSGCGEEIYVGEYTLDVYGMSVHDNYDCLKRATEARTYVAGEDN